MMRPVARFTRLAAPLALLLVGACTEGRGASARLAVSDSAGVPFLTSPGERLDLPLGWTVAAAPRLRLGTIDGAEEEQFSAIAGAARLGDGRILVSEGGARRLRIFAADGSFDRWVGGVGDGPAEYGTSAVAGVMAGDTIWVWDARRRRVVFYAPDGGFVRGIAPDVPDGVTSVRRVTVLTDGRAVLEGTSLGGAAGPGSDGDQIESVTVVVMGRDGEPLDEVTTEPGATHRFTSHTLPDGRRVMLFGLADPTFRALPQFRATDENILRLDPGSFEVRALAHDGTLDRVLRVDRAARPVTPELIRAYEAHRLESVGAEQVAAFEDVMGDPVYADSLPHFERSLIDASGLLWVGEYTRHHGGEPSRWWRFGEDGGVEGFLDLPEGLRLLAIGDGELIAVETDAFDVPYLVVHPLDGDG